MSLLFAVSLALVPWPREISVLDGAVACSEKTIARAVVSFEKDAALPREGYRLSVSKRGVKIVASAEAGAFYAGVTLRQLMGGKGMVPCLEITDEPKFPWRGLHLDEARHFFGKAVVLRLLETMARFKLNVLHWHLTDDQGWRIPIPDCPDLVKAVRPVENRLNFRDLKTEGTYGPYAYTHDELIEIVRRAAELHIRIVPEIEIPGHSRVLLQVRPDLRCSLADAKVDNAACPGKDGTIRFFERALDEVCEIFPSEIIHIGGDECDRSDWKRCPDCKARMEREEIVDVAGLQSWVTAHFERYLAAKGRRLMGWDEIAEGGLPARAAVMSWRGTSTGITAAKSGHDVVMTPNEYCYFDYDQGIIDDPVKYPWNWTALLPLAKVYSFDPLKGIPSEHRWHILGAQGNNWSEMTCSEQELQWKIWPRAAALAEVLWTGPKNCDFKDFIKRMNYCRDALVQEGINVASLQTRENRSLKSELARETTKNGEIVRYTCGTNVSILVLEKGVLVLSASGQPPRRFLHDDFAEVEMISVGGGSYFATARRPNSDIVVTVLFDEERIVAKDRWDEKKE